MGWQDCKLFCAHLRFLSPKICGNTKPEHTFPADARRYKTAEKARILGVRKFDGTALNAELEEGETFIGLARL